MIQKSDKQIKVELMIEALKVLTQKEDENARALIRNELASELRFY